VIAHRYRDKQGRSISLGEAGRLATKPREEQLLPRIGEIQAEVDEVREWVGRNRLRIWDNVDRDGQILKH